MNEAYDRQIIVNKDFSIESSGIEREISFVDYDLPLSETDTSSLRERAIIQWGNLSQEFEKKLGANPANLGMLIFTTDNLADIYIMVEQEGKNELKDIYFEFRGDVYKTSKLKKLKNSKENEDIYGKSMVETYVNVVRSFIKQLNLRQRSASSLS